MEKVSVKGAKLGDPSSGQTIVEEIRNPLEEITISFYIPKVVLQLHAMEHAGEITKETAFPTYAIAYEKQAQQKGDEEIIDFGVTHEPMPGLLTALEIYPYRCRSKIPIYILRFEKDKKEPVPIYKWNYEKAGWERIEK